MVVGPTLQRYDYNFIEGVHNLSICTVECPAVDAAGTIETQFGTVKVKAQAAFEVKGARMERGEDLSNRTKLFHGCTVDMVHPGLEVGGPAGHLVLAQC